MTIEEKKWMLALVDSVESLFAENAALRVTLEYHHVPFRVYQKECAELISDPKLSRLWRQVFDGPRAYIEQSPDLSLAVESLLQAVPRPKKPG
jgi:hypothetical protein